MADDKDPTNLSSRDAAIRDADLQARIEGLPRGGSGLTGMDPREAAYIQQASNLLGGGSGKVIKKAIEEAAPLLRRGIGALMEPTSQETLPVANENMKQTRFWVEYLPVNDAYVALFGDDLGTASRISLRHPDIPALGKKRNIATPLEQQYGAERWEQLPKEQTLFPTLEEIDSTLAKSNLWRDPETNSIVGMENKPPSVAPESLPMDQAGFNIDAYHGTSEPQSEMGADFDVQGDDYIRRFGGSDAKFGTFVNDIGDWFSESPDVADYFAGERTRGRVPQVYPVKLRLQNPAIFDTYEDLEEAYRDWQDQAGPDEDATGTEFANWLKSAGKDGILIENSTTDTGELRKDYVVFDGSNVQSRFWKPGDKDFAAGGFVDKPLYDNARIVGL